jgi:hypothetical protein
LPTETSICSAGTQTIATQTFFEWRLQLRCTVDRRVFGYTGIDAAIAAALCAVVSKLPAGTETYKIAARRLQLRGQCQGALVGDGLTRVIRSETDKLKNLPPKNRRTWYVIP